jgi:hypothetical protein
MGLQTGGHQTLAAGTGTFGYEPNVDYLFGLPKAIKPGGVVFDIPLINVHGMNNGDTTQQKQFVQQTGIISSALEHAVPEQLFVNEQNPGEAISAVKALQKANAQGQRIYHITQTNQATILGNIHHHPDTIAEIKNALNAGKEVITHTDAVSVPNWSGAGYIITDPDTGAGAYKISGGGNGGFLDWWNTNDHGTNIGLVLAITSLFATISSVVPVLIVILALLSIFVAVMNMISFALMDAENNCGGGMATLGISLETVAFILSFFGAAGVALGTWLSFLTGGAISGSVGVCQHA